MDTAESASVKANCMHNEQSSSYFQSPHKKILRICNTPFPEPLCWGFTQQGLTRVLAFWNTWFSISLLDLLWATPAFLMASSLKHKRRRNIYTPPKGLLFRAPSQQAFAQQLSLSGQDVAPSIPTSWDPRKAWREKHSAEQGSNRRGPWEERNRKGGHYEAKDATSMKGLGKSILTEWLQSA